MALPKKPQLAFAWIGEGALLAPLWSAMQTTIVGPHPPRELMPRPSIYAAESELWSYRFSRCEALTELLAMRMHARRSSGVLWLHDASRPPRREVQQMLCYAGGCHLPVVVLVHGLTEATARADRVEGELRSFFDSAGFLADEALFVYAKATHQESLLHLYTRLDEALSAPPEIALPGLQVRGEELEALFFVGQQSAPLPLIKEVLLDIGARRIQIPTATVVRQYSREGFEALVLRLTFGGWVSLAPEQICSATIQLWGGASLRAEACIVLV